MSGFHDNGKNTFVYDSVYATDTTGTDVLQLVSAEIWIVIFLVKTGFISIFILGYHPVLRIIKAALMNGIKKKKVLSILFILSFLPFPANNINATEVM